MRALALLLLTCVGAFAQGGSYCTMSTWEPRNIATKAGLIASYDPGNVGTMVFNPAGYAAGNGVSALSNRVTQGTADLLQGTAANQPRISRADNCGNLILQSEAFNTSWTLGGINAFGATDTGAAGAGSFANTARTTDPLGGNTADFIQENNAAGTHAASQRFNIPAGTYTLSFFAKADANDLIEVFMDGGGATGFDLTTGTMVTCSGDARPPSDSITAIGSGWYLCQITGPLTANNQWFRCYGVTNSAGTYTHTYTGNNTKGFFLWGATVRLASWTTPTGPTAAQGYIATTTLPIRAALANRTILYFDGTIANFYLKKAFTLNQPTEIYLLANHWTWTLNDAVFDGNTLASGEFYESATSPNLRGSAGTAMTEFVPPPPGTWQVDNVIFDGANSRISTNSGAFVVSDANTANMGGFSLGANGTPGGYWNGLMARTLICNKTNLIGEQQYLRWGMLKQAGLY